VSKDSFQVDVDDNETVSSLKEAIVKKKPVTFANIEADELTLWQVSGFSPLSQIYTHEFLAKVSIRSSKQLANVIGKQQFTDENALLGTDRVSGLFPSPEGPAEGVVHIVIQLPACEFSPCLNRSFRER